MLINKKIRNSWKVILEHGDIDKIVKSTIKEGDMNGISRTTISNAIRTGRTSETTFEAIQKFCREKKELQEKFIRENTIEVD